ncbi:MAG: hypothetical protein E3J35_06490 [Methanomassiliicoccales archaeon]|nr:MAG: hypothetical protein E3J35_06490 [Methanomassiliicoccales archaeon]
MRKLPDIRMKNFDKIAFALALILVGVVGRVLLYKYSNFETVLVVSLLAGTLLGKIYALIVPIATMAISDAAIYLLGFGHTFGLGAIIGITIFTWTGYLFVSLIGTRLKGRVICVTKSIALVTGVGLIATVIFDVWTTIGFWFFTLPHTFGGLSFAFVQLAPFAVFHLMSSLMFIPLVGTIFIYVHEHGIPTLNISPIARKSDDDRDSTEACQA